MGAELGKPSGPRPEVLQALETALDGDYRLKFKEVDPVTRAELFAMQQTIHNLKEKSRDCVLTFTQLAAARRRVGSPGGGGEGSRARGRLQARHGGGCCFFRMTFDRGHGSVEGSSLQLRHVLRIESTIHTLNFGR
jgi:hypothetical protein